MAFITVFDKKTGEPYQVRQQVMEHKTLNIPFTSKKPKTKPVNDMPIIADEIIILD